MYVAEPKHPKSSGYLDPVDEKNPPESVGEEFKYREEWGEQLVGISMPRPYLLNLEVDPPVVRVYKEYNIFSIFLIFFLLFMYLCIYIVRLLKVLMMKYQ